MPTPTIALQESALQDFISRWEASDASERANYVLFLTELCDVLGLPKPEPAKADTLLNAYVFEHPVVFSDGVADATTKYIDLYRRGAFVLEAKQGSEKDQAATDTASGGAKKKVRNGTAVRGTSGWYQAMVAAKGRRRCTPKHSRPRTCSGRSTRLRVTKMRDRSSLCTGRVESMRT